MPLSLKESKTISDMAELLYDFLPGSGSSQWKGHVSFKTVANKVGVSAFWQPGSKLPMITTLLERTLEFQRGRFEPLILEIVRSGLTYRQKQSKPILPEDMQKLNGLILELGFKFPDLWDQDFIASLSVDASNRANEYVNRAIQREKLKNTEQMDRRIELNKLKGQFYDLYELVDRSKAGFQLEIVLNRLFELYKLSPRDPFRVIGEQIDGSFVLDYEIYLLEAKWQSNPIPEADLLIFRGKIEGKSKYTRGVFISISGVSKNAVESITIGKQPSFFILNGHDLTMVLEGNIELTDLLRKRQRLLAEEGKVTIPFSDLK